jgi:diacylglycerol O-acyltransferase / wax synthase
MPLPALKHLSGLDATFLYLETPETPMHVGSLHLYELPAGFKGSFHAQVLQHMAKRIHLSSVFTSKLAFMPLDLGHPIWVHDEQFELSRHVRKIGGAKMTVKTAQDKAAALHGRLIDRKHPLWEFYVFDRIVGTDGRVCAGFYSKIHHAALDGKGGTTLANAVLDVSPVPREVPPPNPARKTRSASDLKVGEMIGAVFSNSLAQYAKLAKSLPGAATQIGASLAQNSLLRSGKSAKTTSSTTSPISLAPKTPFNVGINAERVFVTASMPFAECKLMAKSIGASFNDIVLWMCSTALRSYLAKHASIPKKPLVAAMPVSLRDDSNKDLGNQASMSLANLATHIAHPAKRMAAIMESTGKVKKALVSLKAVLPTDYPSFLAPWVVGGAARLALKTYGRGGVVEKLPLVANLVISNVPGPQMPLYMAGARMLTFHPLSIVMHGLGLNITVQTYAGSVDFGIIAGKKALPHAQDLADALLAAFEEAQSLYTLAQTHTAGVTPTPVKTPAPSAAKKPAVATKIIASGTTATKAGAPKSKTTAARRKGAAVLSNRSPFVKALHVPIHGKTKPSQRKP